MTDLRQAAQQALEALEWNYNTDLDNIPACEQWAKMLNETITALKQALAELDSDYERGFVDGMNLQTKRSVDKAVNRMAQTTHWEGCEAVHPECRKPEQEPVLEVRCFGEKRVFVTLFPVEQLKDGEKLYRNLSQEKPVGYFRLEQGIWYQYHEDDAHPETLTPLYTAPTPRKPLTDEEIVDIWAGVSMGYDDQINIIELGRAIERHHGIGEQHE